MVVGRINWICFGQTIACTGILLAAATCAAINGGCYYTPYVVSEIYSGENVLVEKIQPQLKRRVVSEKTSEILNEMLLKVVSEGSGKNAYIDGYDVCGKTGVFGLTCVIIAMKKRGIMA